MGLWEFIIAVVAVNAVAGIVRAGIKAKSARPTGGTASLAAIEQGMADMREQLTALREEVVELNERVDFTERMLAQARDSRQRLGA